MNQALKRIEATLDQLASQGFSAQPCNPTLPKPGGSNFTGSPPASATGRGITVPSSASDASLVPSGATVPISWSLVSPPSDQCPSRLPALPRFKSPSFTSHRNGANPSLAINLLHEIEAVVAGWRDDLQTVIREIQALYLEGPIVDGWLESNPPEGGGDPAPLRHGEMQNLMNYVNQLGGEGEPPAPIAQRTGYRLCGLTPEGQPWSRPCPVEQIPSVSLAIARYHKLRTLLTRKQELETRLSQIAELLVLVHSHLK